MTPTWRPLFCPICGAKLRVEVTDTNYPEVHRLPEHVPAIDVNLCSGVVVTVTLDFDRCSACGCRMSKHPSGKCMKCHSEQDQ